MIAIENLLAGDAHPRLPRLSITPDVGLLSAGRHLLGLCGKLTVVETRERVELDAEAFADHAGSGLL